MGIQKIWSEGSADFTYSDLSGSYKYADILQPRNYFLDTFSQAAQDSFRFFNDDGNESASTPKAALNTNISLNTGGVVRLRFLVDTLGITDSKQFKIECRHKPSGGSFGPWEPVT